MARPRERGWMPRRCWHTFSKFTFRAHSRSLAPGSRHLWLRRNRARATPKPSPRRQEMPAGSWPRPWPTSPSTPAQLRQQAAWLRPLKPAWLHTRCWQRCWTWWCVSQNHRTAPAIRTGVDQRDRAQASCYLARPRTGSTSDAEASNSTSSCVGSASAETRTTCCPPGPMKPRSSVPDSVGETGREHHGTRPTIRPGVAMTRMRAGVARQPPTRAGGLEEVSQMPS
jgi:hypothetical protein